MPELRTACSGLRSDSTIAGMEAHQLQQRHWYWIRRKDGSLAPYVFHQTRHDDEGKIIADFFVGSFLVPFGLNQIEGEATMPKMTKSDE